MITPNLKYIEELSGDDEAFKQNFISILKDEFPDEKSEYLENIAAKAQMEASLNVHKLKHKFNILGLEDSYHFAVTYEEELRAGSDKLHEEFLEILEIIDGFLKSI